MSGTLAQSLHDWRSFYGVTAGVAATLTGLFFVVISLGARMLTGSLLATVRVFATPSVVYFTLVLILSAGLLVPTETLPSLEWGLGTAAVAGFVYVLSLLGGLRERHREEPIDALGWLFHIVIPLASMAGVACGAVGLRLGWPGALDAPGLAVLLLIVTGVRNAWSATLRIALKVE